MSRHTNEELYVPTQKKPHEPTAYDKLQEKYRLPSLKELLHVCAITAAAVLALIVILFLTGLRLTGGETSDGIKVKYFGWIYGGTPALGTMTLSDGRSANVSGGSVSYSDGTIYRGELKGFEPNGFGTLTFADGTTYTGYFKNGKYSSRPDNFGKLSGGKLVNADGSSYEGGFLDGIYHGEGTLSYADGSVFHGEFENGERKSGKLTYYDGSTFEGEFKNDMRYSGKYSWKNGESIEGYFENNMPASGMDQYMIYTDSNGGTYKIRLQDGIILSKTSYTPPVEEENPSNDENQSGSSDDVVG